MTGSELKQARMTLGYSRRELAAANARLIAAAPAMLEALQRVALIAKNLRKYGEVDQQIAHDLTIAVQDALIEGKD